MTFTLIFSAIIVLLYISKIISSGKSLVNTERGISSSDAIFKIMEQDIKRQKLKRIEKLNELNLKPIKQK